jgi:hypothetical protein
VTQRKQERECPISGISDSNIGTAYAARRI